VAGNKVGQDLPVQRWWVSNSRMKVDGLTRGSCGLHGGRDQGLRSSVLQPDMSETGT
jgi:hypothetical protein